VKRRKPSPRAKAGPKSLLDMPERRLRKLAKAAGRKLVKEARPPTPEQLAQRVELLRALMEGQEVVRVPRSAPLPSERNAQTTPAKRKPANRKAGRKRRKAAQKLGRPSGAPTVLAEAKTRLLAGKAPAARKRFRDQLSEWYRGYCKAHPEAPPMAAKTINVHLSSNAEVRALLPKDWLRRR
jgi:hypothetical protein